MAHTFVHKKESSPQVEDGIEQWANQERKEFLGLSEGINLLTTPEICKKLRVSRSTLRRWISAGRVQVIRMVGHKNLFDGAAVEAIRNERL